MISEKLPQHLAERRRRVQRSRCDSEKTDGITRIWRVTQINLDLIRRSSPPADAVKSQLSAGL